MANELKQMARHWVYVRENTHLLNIAVITDLFEEDGKAIKMMIIGRTGSKLLSDRNGV